uniref:Uncharacterized protein n=1 Tax=Callorhinchus milii TaxID=7868 RepID=A0A4W3KE18_CALMI
MKPRYRGRRDQPRKRHMKVKTTKKTRMRRKGQRKTCYAHKQKPSKVIKPKAENEVQNALKAKQRSLNESLRHRISLKKHV